MDWVLDATATPTYSASWYAAAPGLRVHSGFCAIVESDLLKHGPLMIKTMKALGRVSPFTFPSPAPGRQLLLLPKIDNSLTRTSSARRRALARRRPCPSAAG